MSKKQGEERIEKTVISTAKRNRMLAALLIGNCCLFPVSLPAQIGFRTMPSLNVPAGKKYFSTGFGALVSLDRAFLYLDKRWVLGAAVLGGMADFPVEKTSSFSLVEAGFGPFIQWRISDRFSLRGDMNAGIYQYYWDNNSNAKTRIGGALSGQYHMNPFFSFFAEAGYVWYSFSENESINNIRAGAGIQLNLSELMRPEARLRGERIEQQRIFPVSFAWYEKNDFAAIRITNEEPNAITDIEVSFLLERYMNQPSAFASIERLGPGESLEIPVKALFNESMLELTENVNASARVIAGYRSLGMKKTSSFPMQMPVFHRNAMSWDDDRRAASFVSPRDPAAVYFARYVSHAIGPQDPGIIPENVRNAAAIFEALRVYGITYIIDPASSYIELSENAAALDTLNYPYETLMYRGGDCDDLSILFSAILEALNVETAFVTVPGHIFAAFETGDTEWRRGNPDIIEYGGRRWLPVEITIPDRGFSEACRVGARQWRNAGDEAGIYPMHENWLVYPPVSVNAAGDNMPSMPERGAIVSALEAELAKLR